MTLTAQLGLAQLGLLSLGTVLEDVVVVPAPPVAPVVLSFALDLTLSAQLTLSQPPAGVLTLDV